MESPRVLPEAGDRVRFEFDGNLISGTVFVVDPRGGGVCFGVCPSCDVRADDGHALQACSHQRGRAFIG